MGWQNGYRGRQLGDVVGFDEQGVRHLHAGAATDAYTDMLTVATQRTRALGAPGRLISVSTRMMLGGSS